MTGDNVNEVLSSVDVLVSWKNSLCKTKINRLRIIRSGNERLGEEGINHFRVEPHH